MNKKNISMLIVMMLLIVVFSGNSFATFDMGDGIAVDSVRYVKEHNGFSLISSYIEINGSGLLGQTVRFEKTGIGGGFQTMGEQTVDEEGFLKFTFDIEDSNSFGGKIKINGKEIDLDLTGFANITGADKKNVNVDNNDDITFYGNYLNTIAGTATAEFGRGSQTKTFFDSGIGAQETDSLTLTNPTAPGDKGFQNILIKRTTAEVLGVQPEITVENLYANGFRILEDIGITNLHLYPNTGAKNDIANLTGDDFNDTKDYHVYFLKALDGSDDYTSVNEAEIVSLDLNVNGDEDTLSFRVPNHNDFDLRNYYVILTNEKSNEVIAEKVATLDDNSTSAIFTVIDSSYIPTITQVYPESGSDAGSDVQISGKNILTLNIPSLEDSEGEIYTGIFDLDPEGLNGDQKLHLNYLNGVYDEKTVTIDRYVTIQIGKKVSFVKDINDIFVISKAIPDSLLVHTQSIDDAIDDPFKDVVIEIETVLEEVLTSKQYTFKQIVTKTDGYEFIPSTLTPIINEITPNIIQVKDNTLLNIFAKDTLFAIKGEKFLVDREVTPEGEIITKYPTVLIKKDDTNTFETKYQVGFFPNEETIYGGETIRGIIKYKDELEVEHIVTDSDGKPIKLDIKVVNNNGEIVNGTTGNIEGTKILIMIPNETLIEDIGIKHIQVSNIMRDSDEYGNKSILSDSIEFIKTTEVPIIESVTPHIITIEGDEEIVIVGTNFQEGVKVILDGEEITPVQRNIDVQGEKIELIFTAPKGREGTTQLQVINPGGGIDVRDFMYVKTFNKDPYVYSFTPEKGTAQTLVVVNGDNFLKPDPTVSSTIGLDAFRLIGTRLFLDGNDINQYNYDSYNNIVFNSYTSPDPENLIKEVGSKAVFSSFKENVLINKNSDGSLFYLDNDEFDNPLITDGNEEYSIRYEGSVFNAYNENNILIGVATINLTSIAISGGPTFDITMDNNVLRVMEDEKGTEFAEVADYVDSIILEDASETNVFYSLTKNLNNEIILSNGKDEKYIITYNGGFVATEGTALPVPVTVDETTLNLNGNIFNFITAYVTDSVTKEITGDKTRILNKQQIAFNVPVLQTGKGYKDIFVVNPDTKTAGFEDEEGFYYIEQSMSHPVISKIVPNKGSIDGGYSIVIEGSDFEDDTKVYIDGALVPIEDTYVNMDGNEIVVKVPKCSKNLSDDYGVDELKVPVVVLNKDGGSDYREKGFTYMIPISSPVIEEVFLTEGSANGGEIVEIIGFEFRYFEPYTNLIGGPEYNPGDDFKDLYANIGGRKWDDLLDSNVDPLAITSVAFDNDDYDTYYESPILPTIYFGEKKGKIVEFAKGYIKVITPAHDEGTVELYLVNNDYGVSNKIDYKYISSTPQITSIIPDIGRRQGQEYKDVYGTQFDTSILMGYQNDIDDTISTITSANINVRFGNIDNLDTDLFDQNSGRINAQRAEVNLLGGLKVKYYGDTDTLIVQIEENNIRYTRDFTNYDDSEVYIPSEMLKSSEDNYYIPYGLKDVDNSIYNGTNYEFIKVFIKDKRLFVERGYAPSATYDNYNHFVLRTPNYYTIGVVNLTFKNTDGGSSTKSFTYTNPASEPKILKINPRVLSIDEDRWVVNGTIEGIKEIEIVGKDFRDNVQVSINGKNATVEEIVETTIDEETYQAIIAQIPVGSELDVEKEYPVIIINEDSGIANSALLENLLDPVDEYVKMPYYFQYKKPLSGPQIETITPSETSVAGGNKIVITGKDFRENGYVIIGSRGGVPIYDVTVNDTGSIIEFITPTGLSIGDKDVQVLNEDYGIDIVKDGIKIVSHPEVDSTIYTEDGTEVKTRVSVEGGDKIRLKGTGFLENPTVLFGGTYSLRLTDDQTGDVGLNENDEYYIVENGIKATNVEYIDSENIIVTSPPIESEKVYHIVVINNDSGISKDNAIIDYRVPIPSDPVNLEVELIDNRYIKIFNYSSEDVDYFEIYSYLGDKSESKLINNNYMDFSYIDTTKLESYKITNLPGVENMRSDEKLYLVLKAVNKYGPSNWSNIVSLDYNELEDVEEIGPPDDDKDLGVEEGLNYEEIHTENEITLNITDKAIDPTVVITLTDLDDRSTKVINIPGNKVINNTSLIAIDFGDTQLQFTPISFNTQEFRELNFYNDTYARINNEFIDDDYTSIIKNYLPRGKKAISKVYRLGFYAINNIEASEIKELNGNINFGITYDDMYLNESDNVGLFRFNGINSWNEVNALNNETRNTLTIDAKISGYYIILKY